MVFLCLRVQRRSSPETLGSQTTAGPEVECRTVREATLVNMVYCYIVIFKALLKLAWADSV